MPPVVPAELRQPHVGAFRDQHRGGHPGRVGPKISRTRAPDRRRPAPASTCDRRPLLHAGFAAPPGSFLGGPSSHRRRRIELHPDGEFFLVQNLTGDLEKTIQGYRPEAASTADGPGRAAREASLGEAVAGARNSSMRFMGFAPGSGISGRVAKYSGNCRVTSR